MWSAQNERSACKLATFRTIVTGCKNSRVANHSEVLRVMCQTVIRWSHQTVGLIPGLPGRLPWSGIIWSGRAGGFAAWPGRLKMTTKGVFGLEPVSALLAVAGALCDRAETNGCSTGSMSASSATPLLTAASASTGTGMTARLSSRTTYISPKTFSDCDGISMDERKSCFISS